jgi:hypothetical protein
MPVPLPWKAGQFNSGSLQAGSIKPLLRTVTVVGTRGYPHSIASCGQ